MIALTTADGRLIRSFATSGMDLPAEGEVYGFHPTFGFIGERAFRSRMRMRALHGHPKSDTDAGGRSRAPKSWLFQILVKPIKGVMGVPFEVDGVADCTVKKEKDYFVLATPMGALRLFSHSTGQAIAPTEVLQTWNQEDKGSKKVLLLALLLFLLLGGTLIGLHGRLENEAAPLQEMEPIAVNILKPIEKVVQVPQPKFEKPPIPVQQRELKRAIHQNLGFLGLLGKKDLKNAVGGMPTVLKNASAGAGAGGLEGSGGETLVGLGQGVKRTTVGNTGTAGLGGIGTKGAGGGLGGYGTSSIASGEGRTLTTLPLARDMVLEGGLDRSVIQATIAKYLRQVQACYEQGLQRNGQLAGQVSMNFEISGQGAVNFAKVSRTTLGDSQVEGCIAERMLTWRFPKPRGAVNVKVDYPFILRPVKS